MDQIELAHCGEDPSTLKKLFAHCPSPVVALVADCGYGPMGMIVAAFTVGVSLDPPLVSCAIARQSSTWPLLKQAKRIGISVFADSQDHWMQQIGRSAAENRFTDINLKAIKDSTARLIEGASVHFECSLYDELDAGDHQIVLLRIEQAGAKFDRNPLIYHGSVSRSLQSLESQN